MPTDIKLDAADGNRVRVECAVLETTASDVILDAPARKQSPGLRRALVHDHRDGLTINFNGDYPGGVTVAGDLTVVGNLEVAGARIADVLTQVKDQIAELKMEAQRFDTTRLDRVETSLATLADLIGAVVVPPWRTQEEVENGDDMAVLYESAGRLGLEVEYEILQDDPRYDHGQVVRLTPPAGTVLRRGSTVVVRINLQPGN